ncbi:MAG: GNAT family N-acetyltransferase [Chloroflexota bacterium]|nr:GNAT family N-acetyltransferase [Chloroflexota bacterium]
MTDPIRPIIRGQQVYLRTPERADVPLFVAWFNDADVLRHLEMRAPMSVAMEEAWFERMLAAEGKTEYHFVICLLADGRPIGTVGLHDIHERSGNAGFGIAIGEKEEWGKGYGTDALNAICDFGFGELRLERIHLQVYAENERGRRAYLKAGFVHEGTLRRAHFARGQHQDVNVMSQLRDEWQALPRKRSWELSG